METQKYEEHILKELLDSGDGSFEYSIQLANQMILDSGYTSHIAAKIIALATYGDAEININQITKLINTFMLQLTPISYIYQQNAGSYAIRDSNTLQQDLTGSLIINVLLQLARKGMLDSYKQLLNSDNVPKALLDNILPELFEWHIVMEHDWNYLNAVTDHNATRKLETGFYVFSLADVINCIYVAIATQNAEAIKYILRDQRLLNSLLPKLSNRLSNVLRGYIDASSSIQDGTTNYLDQLHTITKSPLSMRELKVLVSTVDTNVFLKVFDMYMQTHEYSIDESFDVLKEAKHNRKLDLSVIGHTIFEHASDDFMAKFTKVRQIAHPELKWFVENEHINVSAQQQMTNNFRRIQENQQRWASNDSPSTSPRRDRLLQKLRSVCTNDTDPISRENFGDLDRYELKHGIVGIDAPQNNKKKNCFIAIHLNEAIKNYLLENKVPVNPLNRVPLSADEVKRTQQKAELIERYRQSIKQRTQDNDESSDVEI